MIAYNRLRSLSQQEQRLGCIQIVIHCSFETIGLCNFAGVMREGKVKTTTVNIQLRSKIAHRHCAAFDVPARTTRSPGTWPRGLTGSLRLPEDKIKGILFTRIVRIVAVLVGNGQHGVIVVEPNGSGHDTELRVLLDAKIDTAVAHVCKAAFQ